MTLYPNSGEASFLAAMNPIEEGEAPVTIAYFMVAVAVAVAVLLYFIVFYIQ